MDTTTAAPAHAAALPTHTRVLVIGAGFGGLGLAIKLAEQGEQDFLVLERGSDVGGTWRDNTYPGAACDVPSQLYSYSFALNPDWSRSFSPQPEIQAYLKRVAAQSSVMNRFRFDTTVEDATWDEEARHWRVRTSAGTLTADLLVSAAGALSEPKMPDIDGIETFQGEVFHSAAWNHDHDLTGKRVAVIGTGASAIQIVPEIARQVAHLDVYQRTAPWVMPRRDRAYTDVERFAFRHVPGLQRIYRTAIYWGRETFVPGFTINPKLAAPAKKMALANIEKGISDPAVREKVTPTFEIGCKRILISNDWYPALERDNVDLVTEGIDKVTGSSIVTRDGVEREIDVLVVATGFHTTDLPIAEKITGRNGETLSTQWEREGMSAYKGATTHGFPNLFFIVGPNTGLGHSSMVFMIESQIAYVLDALRTMDARDIAAVEPMPRAQERWNRDIQRRMKRTVWSTGGCSSWYLDAHGRNVTLWPRTTFKFRQLTRRFDVEQYVVTQDGSAGRSTTRTVGQTA
ncbi:MAG TPA: NAD(P)/FAD-dependent oxidoreductase [Nocardioidaceae bacterium]|nr:NAD(P)/FAD-dependent oxidoreductase [Nocardioidaceae bacterium]